VPIAAGENACWKGFVGECGRHRHAVCVASLFPVHSSSPVLQHTHSMHHPTPHGLTGRYLHPLQLQCACAELRLLIFPGTLVMYKDLRPMGPQHHPTRASLGRASAAVRPLASPSLLPLSPAVPPSQFSAPAQLVVKDDGADASESGGKGIGTGAQLPAEGDRGRTLGFVTNAAGDGIGAGGGILEPTLSKRASVRGGRRPSGSLAIVAAGATAHEQDDDRQQVRQPARSMAGFRSVAGAPPALLAAHQAGLPPEISAFIDAQAQVIADDAAEQGLPPELWMPPPSASGPGAATPAN
jgi:hypothetical protein